MFILEKIYVLESADGTLWSTYTLTDMDNGQSTNFSRKNGLAVAFAVANHPNSALQEESYDDGIASFNAYYVREGY